MTDYHGAARSGQKREKKLKTKFQDCGYTLIKLKEECNQNNLPYEGTIRLTIDDEYIEDGYKYFTVDGFWIEGKSYIELKGGDKQGTTEEKIWFDLQKIADGVYADYPLLYIFEGKKETDKSTKKFIRDLNKLKCSGNIYAQNVRILMSSNINQILLDTLRTNLNERSELH